ncbi:TRAP-type C4-dicarboxylate transport system permease small subunit [Paraburkholderia sp. GV068]|jgi:TRAP-type C4-dicarboxylate transport system permease small subunit|uniref:TRAP transporter small permease protein n=1 Tax=Paraburkholderia graminis TaxID=60548 RepID=A0ABD5CGG2_9BURK|nr:MULTISPECIES: TRAP transporter small permease [Paraburkholderia]ALE58810.1 C4-dicarboxylate ABC transporter substrate-binding protein [Burkholderia sp. HB1]MDQ0626112.1 TRAP-type C4-dicarboxylate transport system permease small subunit [Paraburkholderia graminis]MDR6204416.1 TRAP-type C4-dicarboxylate transport system permease small subunit [Paraburkholderia graminis]PTQ93815.1 TRAP-type C4-dicarboxylate transport system permease small subunit [Paraburkholderia sp. GV072]PUB00517.1 TRAP-typ
MPSPLMSAGKNGIKRFMKRPNDFLFRTLTVIASVSLAALSLLVIYGVVMRYVFSDAPDFVEPIALLLVIVIAMFGAALKVREGGHIGLDSLVKSLPVKGQLIAHVFQHLCLIALAVAIFFGSLEMAETTRHDHIPILGLPEALRYLIPVIASVCIASFSIENLLALFAKKHK